MRVVIALMLFIAGMAVSNAAEPGYYRVVGVANGDILNIRTEANATSEVIGSFNPGAGPVDVQEVVEAQGQAWGRVHASDGDGFVSMKFLEPISVSMVGTTDVPDGLTCGGTEPFWNATITNQKGLAFATMDGESFDLPLRTSQAAIGRNHRFAVVAGKDQSRATAMLGRNEQCSDGMSDRNFSWRIDLLVERDGNAPELYEGCCSLPVAK